MTDAHPTVATDAAVRQHRRLKRGLVAGWIHEISARHGSGASAGAPVESVRATEPVLEPRADQALA